MPFIGKRSHPMPNGKRFVSMRVKFVITAVVTGVSVITAALLLVTGSLHLFRRTYMKPERVNERMEEYIHSFATYVAEEQLSSDDAAAVVRWTRSHRAVYLVVVNGDDDAFGAAGGELWEGGSEPDRKPFFDPIISNDGSHGFSVDETSRMYAVGFQNGVHSVGLVDYSMSRVTDIIILSGILGAVALFLLTMLLYYHLQIRSIVSVSREVMAVSNGALEAEIESSRNDEIGQLAADVNSMRKAILEKMSEREAAWQANRDLLTSVTHDIRTPLTSLLGYMDLMGKDCENLTEEQREYLRICTRKAEQIKSLSDKLFLYFWAYNQAEYTPSAFETYECALLMEQLIGDSIPGMEAEGLSVHTDLSAISPEDRVRLPIEALRRVTDNVFDNVVKYADRRRPVSVRAEREEGMIRILFSNAVGKPKEHTSSTRIGEKTCIGIMEQIGGRYATAREGRIFTAILSLPLTIEQ